MTAAGHGCRWITRLQRYQIETPCPRSAVRRCGNPKRSIRLPTMLSSAGSSVTEANIVNSTASAAPVATARITARFMKYMPSTAMTTVIPANSTERPAVFRLRSTACSGSSPSCRLCR